jgi:endonuclease/exonuclease/phosphatase family metal-dependent hydrolase
MLAVLSLGDVAFTGFQATSNDKISLVLLKDVDAGTEMTVTDNAWSGSALTTNEGTSTVTFNGTFSAGTQINFDVSRPVGSRWAVGNSTTNLSDSTTSFFALSASGDNLFVYNGSQAPTSGTSASWVTAIATSAFQTSGGTNTNQTYLPGIFFGTDSQFNLNLGTGSSNQNGAYTGANVTGTMLQIRAAVHNTANWTTFTAAGGQAIPTPATFTVNGSGALSSSLRFVSYNIAAIDGVRNGLNTILHAIGNEVVAGVARPIDMLAVQEVASQSTTTASVANLLNSIYGAAIYATGALNGASTGGGTQGVVYNTQSLQLIGELAVGTASSSGQPRQTIRHHFQPIGGAASTDFYVYNGHWKALNDAESAERRRVEAQAIRANADSLGNGKNIIYVGDFNTYSGFETSFQTILAAGNGQGFDPINRVGNWSTNSSFVNTFTQAPAANAPNGLVGGGLDDRFDFQILSGELTDGLGLEFRSGTYRAFGNNGSVPLNGSINSSGNTALPGLPNRTTVLNLLTTVSDHLPVVADFFVRPANQAPLGGHNTVNTIRNVAYTFSEADFRFSDPNNSPPNVFDALKVSSLPSAGTLTLSGNPVTNGQFVPVAQIAAGNFRFVPAANSWAVPYSSFTFQVRDDGGTANGGTNLDPQPKTMTINVYQQAGMTVTQPSPSSSTTEAGGSVSFTVVLTAPPIANVTMSVNSTDLSEGSVNISSLMFTRVNWNIPQTVTVTGVDDDVFDGNIAYSVILGAASSKDPHYNFRNPTYVDLVNLDDEDPPVMIPGEGDMAIWPIASSYRRSQGERLKAKGIHDQVEAAERTFERRILVDLYPLFVVTPDVVESVDPMATTSPKHQLTRSSVVTRLELSIIDQVFFGLI